MGAEVTDFMTIGEASRRTGVTTNQRRFWHDRNYLHANPRVVCGERTFRQFTEDDLDLIKAIKKFLDAGLRLPVAAQMAQDSLIKKGEITYED
ncbi:MAG: MerR family transcriptional regulator [Deltaproteobacteria bacterium]|nr:MerR family transcriptional regulator [Deltaproteobacteria bacterium]